MKDDPRFDIAFRAFLPRTYNLKSIADYETAPVRMCLPRAPETRFRPHAALWLRHDPYPTERPCATRAGVRFDVMGLMRPYMLLLVARPSAVRRFQRSTFAAVPHAIRVTGGFARSVLLVMMAYIFTFDTTVLFAFALREAALTAWSAAHGSVSSLAGKITLGARSLSLHIARV